jgi:hypothetical protein
MKGLFILISSEKMEPEEVMPLYYTRQAVEQIFDVSKNNADLLPLRGHGEETFLVISNQKCKVFGDCILPKEPNKKRNDIYKKLGIKPPVSIPVCGKN